MEYQLRERGSEKRPNIVEDQFWLESDQQTLDHLLAINAEIAKRNSHFRNERERIDAATMDHPLTFELSHSYFGAMLGFFPPAAIFLRLLFEIGNSRNIEGWLFALVLFSIVASTIIGYNT
ncbi:MAG: hypothetical protein ABI539_02730, partial [Acidobacteriota bacterium]